MRYPTPEPRVARNLRDVHDVDRYVQTALAGIGVGTGSVLHGPLLEHGVRSVYRLEQALPPHASLRHVLDDVLHVRLAAGLRGSDAGAVRLAA